jgi:hypothetical protein
MQRNAEQSVALEFHSLGALWNPVSFMENSKRRFKDEILSTV